METTIHKCKKSRLYTKISNAVLQDDRLSLKEIGLMAYILSLPDSWSLCMTHLHNRYGRATVTSSMAKLKEFGYLSHQVERDAGSNRILAHRWTAYDDPSENPSVVHKQVFQSVAFPDAGKSAAIKETGERKEIGDKRILCASSKPDAREMPSLEALEEANPDIDIGVMAIAHSQAEDDLAKGKRITSLPAYIVGLARKIEASKTT